MILFVDVETTGLPVPALDRDDPAQPWPVSVAAELCELTGERRGYIERLIRSGGWLMTPGATAVHSISDEEAGRFGGSIEVTTAFVCEMAGEASYVVGWNCGFDRRIIETSITRFTKKVRAGIAWMATARATQRWERVGLSLSALADDLERCTKIWTRPQLRFIDPMIAATQVCKIVPPEPRSDGSYKWPTLDEAGSILLGEAPRGEHHSAADDIQRTKRLFYDLWRRGLIVDMPPYPAEVSS